MEAHQAILQLVLFIFFLVSVQAQNIDVKQPVIRGYPLDGDTGLFGYSVALHQVVASPSDFQSAVEATRQDKAFIMISCMQGDMHACRVIAKHAPGSPHGAWHHIGAASYRFTKHEPRYIDHIHTTLEPQSMLS